ncbi:MAG: molybdopterin-binding protein [Coprobacillus sp.]
MNVEIINVGTELLLGEIVNTNATYLQKVCKDLGFNIYFQTVVGDNPERLYDCFQLAFQRGADCVITTGGLGPTTDDLTKELSAQYLGLEMVYNEAEALKVDHKCRYCTGQNIVPQNNFKQAYYPQDAYILENDMGTANGCVMKKKEKMIINLPGPPKEMTYVVENSLLPYLSKYKQDTIYTYEYTTMFIGESKLEETLRDLIDQQDQVSIALYAGEETVRLRLATKALNQDDADHKMATLKTQIETRIDQYIVKEKDLKEALLKIMVPISIEYKNDFYIKDDFLKPYFSTSPQLKIIVETRQEQLGEVVVFHLNDYVFEVPTFVKASYSYSKIEARFVAQLYKYMKRNNF